MSKCNNCGQEGFAVAEEHSGNIEMCPYMAEKLEARRKRIAKKKGTK